MKNKFFKHLLSFLLIASGLLFFRLALAQDFGLAEVESGLGGSLSSDDPRTIAGRIINVLLGFLGVIALGLIIYAGFLWMTSGGEEDKISKAKKLLVSAVIGLAIILASWAIATFVINRLSDATQGGGGGGCVSGETMSCGCDGIKVCLNGTWQPCVGSDCSGGGFGPTMCDSSPLPGCQADSDICAPQNYCDDNCYCRPRGEVGDSCDGDKTTPTCDANNDLCGEFLSCDSDTCTCYGPPVITSISPAGGFCQEDKNKSCRLDSDCATTCDKITPNGAPENFLTISGKGFGVYEEGISRVIFIAGNRTGLRPATVNPMCVNTWSDSQIIIAIPSGAGDGPIKVIRNDNMEDSSDNDYGPKLPNFIANNIVRPGLCFLSPAEGELSEAVTYQGINLNNGTAYFGSYQSNVRALNSNFSFPAGTSGTAQVPNIRSGATTSFVTSTFGGNQENSNYLRFTKKADPREGAYIVSFSPTQGRSGQYVTINGSGFGGIKGDSRVYFGDQEANYTFPPVCASSVWGDNQVIVKVPEGINNGNYLIRMTIGGQNIDTAQLNPNIFQADDSLSLKTSICKLEPRQGAVSTPVKIYGEYFGAENSSGVAQFNVQKNISGTIKKESAADVLAVSVPADAITGPVRVVKNGEWGNEANFEVGSCTSNDNCPGQVCCPANTYKKGRCVNVLLDCLIDIPTSVFEWKFSTGYVNPSQIDPTESCATIANRFGSCQVGSFCPNAPGVCSPYAGGSEKTVGNCDYSCISIAGCGGGIGTSICSYDPTINKCVKSGSDGTCSLSKKQTFIIQEQSYEFNLTCSTGGQWQFTTPMSCPDGWERSVNNTCIDRSSSCDVCISGLNCERVGSEGRCVSNSICPAGSLCKDEPDDTLDRCVVNDSPSCDCCCRIGNSAQDCCAPLQCTGTCGQDTTDDGAGYGLCSGCANAGSTTASRDAACNCTGRSGQFCSVTTERQDGVCTDCSGLKTQEACAEHAGSCCFDAKNNICRGGSGTALTDNPSDSDYGYCAYYNCSASDSTTCASSAPVKDGFYKDIAACESGCASGIDPCNQFNGSKDSCVAMGSCCYDLASSICRQGGQITSGPDIGYCAYYNCGDPNATPPGNPETCDNNPKTTGAYNNLNTCSLICSGGFSGAGQDCVSSSNVLACSFSACNYPSMSCLTDSGASAGDISDCGTCCCSPSDPNACNVGGPAGVLYCQPNQGKCSGNNRGLCCGCSQDVDCVGGVGSAENVGCGLDTCCQARPRVIESMPLNNASNVCRNASIEVTFDQIMDSATFNANILLIQEMNYGSGICPSGAFVYDNFKSNKGGILDKLARFFQRVKTSSEKMIARIFRGESSALANLPDPNKLYCATPVMVSAYHNDEQTVAIIRPRNLLAPGARYYLVVKGDEQLNSQLGVTSMKGIGMNGEGLLLSGGAVEGVDIQFNKTSYINSHIFQFTTLSDRDTNAGVCAISTVKIRPSSYLFKTTNNSLDENDNNPSHNTFDTVYDRDKVFAAWAYSADGQAIQPVTGYFWNWDFSLTNSTIVSMRTRADFAGLASNRAFISARETATDGESKLIAAVNMTPFLSGDSNEDPACVCADDICSNRCLNAFSFGDSMAATSDIYVFICENPWPPVSGGEWYPWRDNCEGAIGGCADFNYKFYYCRDAGQPGTHDDLPAIIDKAVIRGQSATLTCSSDSSTCSAVNTPCGADLNGDGTADGICIWNILKESYFFREAVSSAGTLTAVTDKKTNGEVLLTWTSSSAQAASYKIYYGELGKAMTGSQEFNASEVCNLVGAFYNCSATVSNLKNNQAYNFRLSVLTANKAESVLSNEMRATPTDQTPYGAPSRLNVEIKDNKFIFSWDDYDTGSNKIYRLYHGVFPSRYGESFDSISQAKKLEFSLDRFNLGDHYFAVSSIDASGNESAKSLEISFVKSSCDSDAPNCFKFVTFEGILTNVDFEQTTSTGLPQDWSISQQKYSSVRISTAEQFSGRQSVLLHQDQGHPYPGQCNAQVCTSHPSCTWNTTSKTCSFTAKDDCHPNEAAVYQEGETLCWGNSNRVMWLRLAYNLAKLDLKQGDKYSISFYYKGKTAGNVAVSMSPSLGWSTQCIHYSSINALRPGYTWTGGAITPTPPAGANPCNVSYGAPCSEQANYCCVQSPYQTACYSAINMPTIRINTYDDWTWYYYQFEYRDQMASWLDRNGNKLIEMGMAIGYNSTVSGGTDFYVDDFVVRKITSGVEINY